jgi:hypothetical protein
MTLFARSMRTSLISGAAAVTIAGAGVIFLADVAFAQNPHFIFCNLSLDTTTRDVSKQNEPPFIVTTGATLNVSWKEAGLGNNQNIDYLLEADATAEWACINNGGNFPQDPKKQTVEGPVTAEGTFSSGQNGQITASLSVEAPNRDQGLSL